MLSVRNTSSKLDVNFVSLSRMRNLTAWERSVRSEVRLRACWMTYSPAWVGGDAGEIDPSGVDLDEEQHAEPAKQHCVDVEEVTGQHRRRLSTQEL
jgi:hypothetical protein